MAHMRQDLAAKIDLEIHIPIARRLNPKRIRGHDRSNSEICGREAGPPHFRNIPAPTPRPGVASGLPGRATVEGHRNWRLLRTFVDWCMTSMSCKLSLLRRTIESQAVYRSLNVSRRRQ